MEEPDESLPLMDLPDELLLRILAGAGSRGVVNCAAACKRLQGTQVALAGFSCFASAASQAPKLEDAVKDCAARALEGMMGKAAVE
ncbi:hypothetical protein FOA52_015925 [Chlamydomonas sp. UWO 241]|nr:hypothetical protein FOA52_015925 [Chlamydomonas sp. UWO 241]